MRILMILVLVSVIALILTSCGKYAPEINTDSTAQTDSRLETNSTVETNSEVSGSTTHEIRTSIDRVLDICGFSEGVTWEVAQEWQVQCIQILGLQDILKGLPVDLN